MQLMVVYASQKSSKELGEDQVEVVYVFREHPGRLPIGGVLGGAPGADPGHIGEMACPS